MSFQNLDTIHRKLCFIEVESLKSNKLSVAGVTVLFRLAYELSMEFNKYRKIGIPSEYSIPLIHTVEQLSKNLKINLKEVLKEKVKHAYFPDINSGREPSVDQLLREQLSFFNLMEELWSLDPIETESKAILHHLDQEFVAFEDLVNKIAATNNQSEKEIQLDVCRDIRLRAIYLEGKLADKLGIV